MKKKLIILASGLIMMLAVIICIIVAILMVFDFFGSNSSDGYVESNEEYAEAYKEVLNKNIRYGNGYVPLERLLYFYTEMEDIEFDEIYSDNIDSDTKKQRDLSDVCLMEKYSYLSVCDEEEVEESTFAGEDQVKPFNAPLDIANMYVTSFFMEERTVFTIFNIHQAWDLSASNETPVYATCDGEVVDVSFTFEQNIADQNGGGGNQIRIECEIDDDIKYQVLYAHLYPSSAKVEIGDKVSHWQEIATVGQTGYATGPHLHYQVEQNGLTIDGMSLIDFTFENEDSDIEEPIEDPPSIEETEPIKEEIDNTPVYI